MTLTKGDADLVPRFSHRFMNHRTLPCEFQVHGLDKERIAGHDSDKGRGDLVPRFSLRWLCHVRARFSTLRV